MDDLRELVKQWRKEAERLEAIATSTMDIRRSETFEVCANELESALAAKEERSEKL